MRVRFLRISYEEHQLLNTKNAHRDWPLGAKSLVGIFSCLIGLGIVYFGFGIGTESPKKEASARATPVAPRDLTRPVRAMNLALGNMVFFAQDLSFSVKSTKNNSVDASKVAARIENQLQGMREIYRVESAKNPALVGSLLLQFNISPAGEVSQVKEVTGRLNDGEFKKTVIEETAKWSFAEIVSENLIVTCPLLFVHEGMDITTLVQWEKTIGNLADKLAANTAPNQSAKLAEAPPSSNGAIKSTVAAAVKTEPAVKPDGKVFQIKYATSLRTQPNFSATSLITFTIGTKVTVLRKQGDWLEVRSTDNGPAGFIRKEFITPVEVVRK